MLALLLALACSRTTAVSEAPATEGPAVEAAAEQVLSSAPSEAAATPAQVDRYGLTLGRSTHEDVLAWLSERQLSCQQFPAPTRTSFYYRCDGRLPTSLLPDRTIRGVLAQILITRPENAPIYHWSTLRKYSLAQDAAEDFSTTLAAISTELGPANVTRPLGDLATLEKPMARAAADWSSGGLEVSLVLLKITGPALTVSETWSLSDLKSSVAAKERDGSVQGGPGKRPPGWNPHVSEIPSFNTR